MRIEVSSTMSQNAENVNDTPLELIYMSDCHNGVTNELKEVIGNYTGNSVWLTKLFHEFGMVNNDSTEDRVANIMLKNKTLVHCIAISRNGADLIERYSSEVMAFATEQNGADFRAYSKKQGKLLERAMGKYTTWFECKLALVNFLLELAEKEEEYQIDIEETIWLYYLREMLLVVKDLPELKQLVEEYSAF